MKNESILSLSTYDHAHCEKDVHALWEQENVNSFEQESSKTVFSIDTPPPTVSGSLHIGHIFSYTHADIIARYKRMSGYNVFYPMGFDDNGLATERFVEKKNATKAHLMKRSDFIALCLKESQEAERGFEKLWRSMGLSIDWAKTYSTISKRVRQLSQRSFIELYKKGLIDHKEEPSLYCTTCQTSVAQAELDSQECATTFNDIAFETEDGTFLTVATTRPELLPACVALFYNPQDTRYAHLRGKKARTPIYNKLVPIIADELVEQDKGTGLVMCCTFGDQTDILWYKKHSLPCIEALGRDGKWTALSGALEGLRAHEARKTILELLKNGGLLLSQKPIKHAVNIHERCKQEIEFLILKQWFIKILQHKEAFLARADELNWTPAFMKSRYIDWVKNLKWDWCISRQRFYGIPFPVWHCENCSHIILAQTNELPLDPQESKAPAQCPQCSSSSLRADTDVMDTWATSGLTPFIHTGFYENKGDVTLPMSMRPQAHDIIRTWAFYTIIMAHYHSDTLPWTDIVISGHVKAGKEKISKSQGGATLTPQHLLDNYPADAIRYWTAQGRPGLDTAFSNNELKVGHRLLTKLWNAFRFCKDFIEDFTPGKDAKLDDINAWLLSELSSATAQYHKHFETFDYTHALQEVENFFWKSFCDNYLELIKDRLYKPENYTPEEIAATKQTLFRAGFGILQLFAPFIPHLTETLYQLLFKKHEKIKSLHLTQIEAARYNYSNPVAQQITMLMLSIIDQVRKLKSTSALSLKTTLQELIIHSKDADLVLRLKNNQTTLGAITGAEKISYKEEFLKEARLKNENNVLVAYVGIFNDNN